MNTKNKQEEDSLCFSRLELEQKAILVSRFVFQDDEILVQFEGVKQSIMNKKSWSMDL